MRWPAPRRLHGRQRLEDLTPALHAATALLAQALGPRAAAWLAALRPPAGTAQSASPWRAFALRRLHPMERPRVARAWAEAAAQARPAARRCRQPLFSPIACRLLDTPLPPRCEPR